jgi:Zn-finger nucleic acid-binding protein
MNCPVDGSELRISDRQGVEIDYCPKCRGVWLDRGELDKVIERAAKAPSYSDEPRGGREEYYEDREEQRPRKRRSFLDDLFDFGD